VVAQSRTNAQIAAQLHISIGMVSSHLDPIRDNASCRCRAELDPARPDRRPDLAAWGLPSAWSVRAGVVICPEPLRGKKGQLILVLRLSGRASLSGASQDSRPRTRRRRPCSSNPDLATQLADEHQRQMRPTLASDGTRMHARHPGPPVTTRILSCLARGSPGPTRQRRRCPAPSGRPARLFGEPAAPTPYARLQPLAARHTRHHGK